MALIAAVMWGTTGTARALGPADASPLAVGAARILIGGALLFVLAAGRGTLFAWRPPAAAAAASAIAVAAYQLTFFAGVARAGVAVGTILAIGSAPLFAGVLAWALLRERPSTRWLVATALAIAGLVLLAAPTAAAFDALALLLPLGAGLAYAVYATASKRLVATGDTASAAAIAFAGGALLLLPVLALSDLAWLREPRGIAAALWLGVVATAAAYLLFTRALARLPVSHGATLSLAEPLTATLLATVVLGESLAVPQIAGAGLVAAGLIVLSTGAEAS